MAECLRCGSPYAWVRETRVADVDGALVRLRRVQCSPRPAGCGRYYQTAERMDGEPVKRAVPWGICSRRGAMRAARRAAVLLRVGAKR